MCGLIGYISKSKAGDAGRHVVTQYQDQLHRGEKGFGVVEIMQDGITIERATEPIKALMDARMSQASVMFFHHRYPTSTTNKMKQTHPFMISHDELAHDYCVMHNGVIRNKDELFKEHTGELGYVYKSYEQVSTSYQYSANTLRDSFNDSEALSIEVARFFNGNSSQIEALGDSAFLAVKLEKKTGKPLELIWGRDKGRTLEVLETEHGILIASEIEDMNAEMITELTFEVLDLQKYFNSKAKVYDVYNKIQAGELKFAEPPKPAATPSFGFGSHSKDDNKASSTTQKSSSTGGANTSSGKHDSLVPYRASIDDELEIDEMMEDIDSGFYAGYRTPREEAFNTMGERVCDDINQDIMLFMESLAYGDVGEDDAVEVANRLNDLLLEKIEVAISKVIPHFENKEQREIEGITADIQADVDAAIDTDDDDVRLSDLVGTA